VAGTTVDDPVVSAAIGVQGALTRWLAGLGAGAVGLAALAVLAVTAGVVVRAARHRGMASSVPEDSLP
jgi:hypothetical protein